MNTVLFFILNFYLKIIAGRIPAIIAAVAVIPITSYIYRWRNPKCRGALPPGTSGFPLIGETLQLVRPSASFDLIPFLKTRIRRYGPIFRTNIAGRHVIISADPEFNRYLLRRDGELMESWPLDTFVQTVMDSQFLEKYSRKFVLHHFGAELIKEKLIPQLEETANQTLCEWSGQGSVEVKGAFVTMAVTLSVQQFFSGELEIAQLSQMLKDFAQGLMSFPLNIPGTAHHKCLQIQKRVKRLIKDVVQRRLGLDKKSHPGDLLDHIIQEIGSQEAINGDFVVQFLFSLLFVTSESISTTLALALKLLNDHPAVVEELSAEQETIRKRREKIDSPLTWSEYKSMTFTIQVIHEVLRLANTSPGIFRRALKDIPANGYVIPQGWSVIIATSVPHIDSNQFEDPLSFNPWRWKNIEPEVVSKCFLPFGSGMRQCTGAEYAKAFMATFLHVMVTKYRFTMVKNGRTVRAPILNFPDGFHFNVSKKRN